MARVVLLTGSNRGEKRALLESAKRYIAAEVGEIVQESQVYESEPWGFSDPECFLNQALVAETGLEPLDVLDRIQAIEARLGRRRGGEEQKEAEERKYEARPIDIDILFYDDRIIENDRLTVPHPLIPVREFALKPLREILGDFVHPVFGKPIREM